ncbi:MAG TPA: wax ester/triacylglycerol synthase domain-containing protein [Dermatophilaceae bacterium]|nr:wax ester/triacylglycerol synthase domain-containing protein [Dermatophilaceae bacterium]
MQQLTGMDGLFLGVDASDASNGIIGALLKYTAPDADAGSRERMIERIQGRLDTIPPLRWGMTGLPVGINNAWLHEIDVNVADHVRELTIEAPGGDHELAAAVAEVMMRPLPEGPMWDFTVLRGLPDNQLAHLMRLHHGVIDGGLVQMVVDLLSDAPITPTDPADARPLTKSALPDHVEVLARSLVNSAMSPIRLFSLTAKTGKYLLGRSKKEGALVLPAFIARMLPGEVGKPLTMLVNGHQKLIKRPEVHPLIPTIKVPATSFNARITENRVFAFADHNLADFKDVGKALGMTLNDVVIGCLTGAVRRYLQEHGGVPDRPLICSVPISLRTGQEKERWANHVSGFWTELPTHLEDPVERLHAVHEDIKVGKETFDALPSHIMRDAMRVMLPISMVSISYKLMSMAPDWYPGTAWNVVVSNVRGPGKTITMCGAEMTGFWPVGFLTPGTGLNVVLQSYKDRLDFGFLGCTDLMPDLWEMVRYMEESLSELKGIVLDLQSAEAARS